MTETAVPIPLKKLFVVLDPTRMVQPALEKAEWLAERNQARLHLYCCVYDTHLAFQKRAQDAAVEAATRWIDRLAAQSRSKGLEVSTEIEANPDWRDAVVAAAASAGSDLVVKTASLHGPVTRRLMKTADWILIRHCPSPMLLVSPMQPVNTSVVLTAVKLKPVDDTHVTLNQRVVDSAHAIAGMLDAELHAVTVYRGDDMFFDRQQFANSCRLPRNRVHSVEGAVHRGIAEVASKLDAGIVVVGSAHGAEEPGVTADAARRVIDELRGADVVILPAS